MMETKPKTDMIRCGNGGCLKEGYQRCSKCANQYYCSSECQKMDWNSHKITCRPVEGSSVKPPSTIMECGQFIMNEYYDENGSIIMPPIFHHNYADNMENIDNPTAAQQNFEISQQGAEVEKIVYEYLNAIRKSSDKKVTILHSVKISKKKIDVVKNEFHNVPHAMSDFQSSYKGREYETDFVAVVDGVGVVVTEVKAAFHSSDYKQLDRAETMICDFVKLFANEETAVPILKVYAIPTKSKSDSHHNKGGYCHVFAEDMSSQSWWYGNVLQQLGRMCPAPDTEVLQKLAQFLTGFQCIDKSTAHSPTFNTEVCSDVFWIKAIDKQLKESILSVKGCTTKAGQPHNPQLLKYLGKNARRLFKIRYLTEQQNDLLSNESYKKAFIEGPAGAGKTLCLLMKMEMLLKKGSRIIFATTEAQIQKITDFFDRIEIKPEMAALDDNISDIIENSRSDVVVVYTRTSFIQSSAHVVSILKWSTTFHIFIDDIQSKELQLTDHQPLIEALHVVLGNDKYFWVADDLVQHMYDTNHNIFEFYNFLEKSLTSFHLQFTLRNASDIHKFLLVIRNSALKMDSRLGRFTPSYPVGQSNIGHVIHGVKPCIFVINNTTMPPEEKLSKVRSIVIDKIKGFTKKHVTLNLNDIALLVDPILKTKLEKKEFFEKFLKDCLDEIGVASSSIADQGSDPDQQSVAVGNLGQSYSHEWASVIVVCDYSDVNTSLQWRMRHLYISVSRARVASTVIMIDNDDEKRFQKWIESEEADKIADVQYL